MIVLCHSPLEISMLYNLLVSMWKASIQTLLRFYLWVTGASSPDMLHWFFESLFSIFSTTYWPHFTARVFPLTRPSSLTHPPVSDPPDQLCLHCPGAKRQEPLRVLLPRGAAWLLPGPGNGGHSQSHGLELRLHAGLRGQLRRERRRCLPPDIQRSRLGSWLCCCEFTALTIRDYSCIKPCCSLSLKD